jgi:hypothetical protein
MKLIIGTHQIVFCIYNLTINFRISNVLRYQIFLMKQELLLITQKHSDETRIFTPFSNFISLLSTT